MHETWQMPQRPVFIEEQMFNAATVAPSPHMYVSVRISMRLE